MERIGGDRSDNHAHTGRVVRDGVNQDEGPGGLVLGVGVEEQLFRRYQHGPPDFVQFQVVCGVLFERIHVNLVAEVVDAAARGVRE